MASRKTGKRAASAASRTLRSGSTSRASKSAAGSALAQRRTNKVYRAQSGPPLQRRCATAAHPKHLSGLPQARSLSCRDGASSRARVVRSGTPASRRLSGRRLAAAAESPPVRTRRECGAISFESAPLKVYLDDLRSCGGGGTPPAQPARRQRTTAARRLTRKLRHRRSRQ